MLLPGKSRLRRTTIVFWMLLFYILAALIWWFISLERQNRQIARERYASLEIRQNQQPLPGYTAEISKIRKESNRNTAKYIGEGVTFFFLIIIGAVIVYRSVRRQFRARLQQQNFMMAVTHELKTPIAVTRLNLETLQKYSLEPEKQKKILRNTLDEIHRLNLLTNNILMSAQLEGGRYHFSRDELNLSDLVNDCIRDFRNRFPDRDFSAHIEEEAEIKGDPLLLQMLINNLLENAVKYSAKENPVAAGLQKDQGKIILRVADQGIGIPEAERNKIFTKFYRIGNEGTRKTQGTGLGLYLCRKIARDHNADILMTNNTPRGSIFTVIFKT